ncbi:MAG: hypothetical protein WC294_08065 [Methanoregula sp.]|jgi:hypothetical protein
MTKSKYIFEQLARPNECWHESEYEWDKCDKPHYGGWPPPDFSTWSGFGWAWERVIEKPWYPDFIKFATYIDNTEEEIEADFLMKKMGLNNFIHPQRFIDALYDFLKGGRT